MKPGLSNKGKNWVFLITLAIALLNGFVVGPRGSFADALTYMSEEQRKAWLLIEPDSIISAPGSTVIINVSVADVADLFGWDITVLFDPSILNCTDAWYPADHVFAGKNYWSLPVGIHNDEGRVSYGCLLFIGEKTFSGSGTLCQIEFKVLKQAEAMLTFHKGYTCLIDPDRNKIPIQGWEEPEDPAQKEEEARREEAARNLLTFMGWKNVSFKGKFANFTKVSAEGKLYDVSVKAEVWWNRDVFGGFTLESVPNLPEKSAEECLDVARKFVAHYAELFDLSSRSKYASMKHYAEMIPSTFVDGQIIEKGIYVLQINSTKTGYLLKWGIANIDGYKLSSIWFQTELTVTKSGIITCVTQEPRYIANSAEVNITPEQAIKIAELYLNYTEVYEFLEKCSIYTTVKVISTDVQLEVAVGFLGEDPLVPWVERGNDTHMLYPRWHVRFYFDKKIPIDSRTKLIGYEVCLWADNGELVGKRSYPTEPYHWEAQIITDNLCVGEPEVEQSPQLSPYILVAPIATAIILLGIGVYKNRKKFGR